MPQCDTKALLNRESLVKEFLRKNLNEIYKENFVTIVLGSGFKPVAKEFPIKRTLELKEENGFYISGVFWAWLTSTPKQMGGQENVVFLDGRIHLYEGFQPEEVIFNLNCFLQANMQCRYFNQCIR